MSVSNKGKRHKPTKKRGKSKCTPCGKAHDIAHAYAPKRKTRFLVYITWQSENVETCVFFFSLLRSWSRSSWFLEGSTDCLGWAMPAARMQSLFVLLRKRKDWTCTFMAMCLSNGRTVRKKQSACLQHVHCSALGAQVAMPCRMRSDTLVDGRSWFF
jgi:hypothetical protein